MLEAFGRFLYRRRWPVAIVWVILLAGCVPAFFLVKDVLKVGGFSADDLESARARAVFRQELDLGGSVLTVIFTHPEWPARDPRFIAEAERALAGLDGLPQVMRVVPYTVNQGQISPDGRTAYSNIVLSVAPEVSQRLMPEFERRIQPPENVTMYLAGAPAFYADIEHLTEADLRRAETISFPFAIVALALVFGSAVAAGLPVLVGGASVVATLAIIFLVGQVLDLSIFVTNVVTMLGLGLGMDYSLLMTSRFREELRDHPVGEAVVRTVATAGRAVVFSGLTVCIGLAGLFLFDFMMLRSIGFGGALVVFFSVLAAVTLLPAVLGILGPRVSALRVRPIAGRERPGLWAGLATWVMRHPVLVILPVLAGLLLLGAPFLHVRLSAPDARILPDSVPSRQGFNLLSAAFGESELSPILIAVRTADPVLSPAGLDALYDYTRRIEADPRVLRVGSIVNLDPRITRDQYKLLYADPNRIPDRYAQSTVAALARDRVALVSVITRVPPLSEDARNLVRDIRAMDTPPGLTHLVDGGTAELMDVVDRLYTDFPRALALIVLTTYLILFLLFRSIVLPVKAILMNSLSILASYGALVWVFQDGNLAGLLRFTPLGYVEATLPIIMFCILFGLSMDYEIFLLTRIKEAYDQTGDNTKSVAIGLERSGRIITSAALIVVLVSFSFVAADIILIKALGLGVALAVLLDATIIRALLVPATMRVLGRWNWWSPFKTPALPFLGGVVLLLAGCAGGPAARPGIPPLPAPSPTATIPAGVPLVTLPADARPHDSLTEWWYYTGHLRTADDRLFGFELVFFQATRARQPTGYAAHFALTDSAGGRFYQAERTDTLPAGSPLPDRFDLRVADWRMRAEDGGERLQAALDGATIDLRLTDRKPAALHQGTGLIEFGPAGRSFYYSRTRIDATGTLTLAGQPRTVTGQAWMDHQWGDFLVVGGERGGGWDWFAFQLDDGRDLMLSLLRDAAGNWFLPYGTLVEADGTRVDLPAGSFTVSVLDRWTSPRTGTRYPARWRIEVPAHRLDLIATPTLADQELVTTESTGVTYWEGQVRLQGTAADRPIGGLGYVELTGYTNR